MPVGIVFKGSGFYATDHRSPSGVNYHSSPKAEDKSTPQTETSHKDKTEAKTSPPDEG